MSKDKAYKLLARQEGMSHALAKRIIDNGMVLVDGTRLSIAREEVSESTVFQVIRQSSELIFQDDRVIAISKRIGLDSYMLQERYGAELINRLDKDTSGIILLAKTRSFREEAVREFRHGRVVKLYKAMVHGKLCEEVVINKSIKTIKGRRAYSFVSKDGKPSTSIVRPISVLDNKSIIEVETKTGRTHQIRVHLSYMGHPIIGDMVYNDLDSRRSSRMHLHCSYTSLLGYEFKSPIKFMWT